MVKSLNIFILVFLLFGFIALKSSATDTAVCQSEIDCAQQCDQYEEQLNSDENLPDVYNCQITGFLETGTIEADGTTQAHTEYNCLCVTIGKKDENGNGSDGGGKEKPPVILNPLIPNLPGGQLPPDNGFAECMAKASQREIEMRQRCGNELLQDWIPGTNEEYKRLVLGGDFLRCIERAEKIGSEMRKECHKKWAKKSIDSITPFEYLK